MADECEIRVLRGTDADFTAHLDDLARLRISVFREFPYLYDGDLEYERNYLRTYAECAESLVVLVLVGRAVVGASSGLPLEYETDAFKRPFAASGRDPRAVFYCGESVLLPAYRGRGLYRSFFSHREAHARRLGRFATMALCAVERPENHPRRPPDYVPLDAIWNRFGYQRQSDLRTTYEWKDLDEAAASPKPMVFWEKRL